MSDSAPANRLAHETSPYLLQHAHNPVDWYPWGREALDRARAENKPILLSIGYSACHWCHVMAHESFEDPQTARVMNELFVNIKVDREERPDLDKIYQYAFQLLNGRPGGWPLTVFLTPDDQAPFFAGTYFPREPRHGLLAFTDLMQRLDQVYHQQEGKVREQNRSLLQALQAGPPRQAKTGYALNAQPLSDVREQLGRLFDPVHGGFGKAPKFPQPTHIERLLRHWAAGAAGDEPDREAETMARLSLRQMARGGIYDQLGGGFCRYSVDERWLIPHFEKMLYDNGPLLALNAEAWAATQDPLFKRVAEETAGWAIREMQSPQGGFYAALDADSEGEEGRFYVWTREEVQGLLEPREYTVFAPRFGLDLEPNFEGRWHLYLARDLDQVAAEAGLELDQARALIDSARHKLLAAREERVRPGRDEKILTAWNGLMIRGLAVAGRLLGRDDWLAAARRGLDFVRAELWRDGRLRASTKDGRPGQLGFLDDYALLMDALLELLQARWRRADLDWLLELAQVTLDHFQDPRKGGFYFTSDEHEPLIQRPKPLHDESMPAGNGIVARVLLRLGHLLGSVPYLVAAEKTLKTAWPAMEQTPLGCCALLLALEEYYQPGQTLVLRGEPRALEAWQERCIRPYAPRRLTLAIPAAETDLPGQLDQRRPTGEAVAYACRGTQCSAPITTLAELEEELAATEVLELPPRP